MKSTVFLLVLAVLAGGCSTFNRVFPDRSKDYEQAESMPDLEIPPDLTAGSINNSMAIPGERNRTAPPQVSDQASQTADRAPQMTNRSPQAANQVPVMATIESINNNKPMLSIPEEFTQAWTEMERILNNAEIKINEQDQSTGVFKISYSPDGGSGSRSLLTMIKTWDWRTSAKPRDYQLSLTGVGNKTEVVVLDEDGEWLGDENVNILLTTIRDHYNLGKTQ